jgi:enoyl-CoA hydratase/carnithine racemase
MSARILVSSQGGVAHVVLNRPAKKNGLDEAMFDGLIAAGEQLMADRTVRAVVLSGSGDCFCAGLDFQAFMAGGEAVAMKLLGGRVGPANVAQRAAWVWQELRVPVIAAIEGVAFGGGMQIAAGADLRYCTPTARFSVMEIKWGLVPDMGITKTLGPLLRPDVLLELAMTGRIVDASEAASLGLVTRVCDDPIAQALETAALFASKSPDAVQRCKVMFQGARDTDVRSAFALESALQEQILGQHNQLEAVMANFQKRAPVFHDATWPESS